MKRFCWLIAVVLALAAAAAVWCCCGGGGNRPAMVQSAYVWQRSWTPAVVDGVRTCPTGLSKLIVLTAQVDWDGVTPRVTLVQPDYDALRRAGLSVGLALRVTARRTPLDPSEPAVAQVAALARSLVETARAAGIEPVEFQVDYDSAESRLGEYREWLGSLRRAVLPVPLTITMLPCWLGNRDVEALVRATDGFVLQVHSLEPPATFDPAEALRLVDVEAARAAVRRAATLGVPFEVALPTYGYLAAFGPEGRLLGLTAEGQRPNWPPSAVLRDVRADPAAMAMLVRAWTDRRPGTMRGVIWYRLPVSGDERNWASGTLGCVMKGEVPDPALAARTIVTDDGRLIDIELTNTGKADARLDGVRVTVGVGAQRLEAQDGIGGFIARQAGNGVILAARGMGIPDLLRPGERRVVGWVRFSEPGPVSVEVGTR
jgi:hypothetical protein